MRKAVRSKYEEKRPVRASMRTTKSGDVVTVQAHMATRNIADTQQDLFSPETIQAVQTIQKPKQTRRAKQQQKDSRKTAATQGFRMTKRDKDGKLVTTTGNPLPEHITKLPIPPAWKNVMFNPHPNGTLLVLGIAANGKPQYIYSEKHMQDAAVAKWARIDELNRKIKEITKQVDKDVAKGDHRAIITKLLIETGIRVGSDADTKAKKKAYGASTLEARHVTVTPKGTVILKYTGKSGVNASIKIKDPNLAQIIKGLAEGNGPKERIFNTTYREVSDYTQNLDGGGFLCKDFRSLKATQVATEMVNRMRPPKNMKEYKKMVREVAKGVAKELNNTPAVALKSYINPAIFAEWKISAGVE